MARPPLWRESLVGLEAARLLRSPVFKGEGVADGRGRPVLLVPGFLAGDDSLSVMTRWLRRTGHHTSKAGMRSNIACSSKAVGRLEERLERLVERQGMPAAIIGQSRGGTFAKVLGQRRPDLVAGVVTLGTPHARPLAIHPLVGLQVVAVGALGTIGAPGCFSRSCLKGACCERFWQDCERPMHPDVRFVSVYSRRDGVVDWQACLPGDAEHVEIRASHIGMAVNAEAFGAVASALASLPRSASRGARTGRRAAAQQSLRRAA
jgi:triacylglycerol lipase